MWKISFSFCFVSDVQRKKDAVTEHVTEDMLKEVIDVYISETDNISLLDITSTFVSVDADDAEAITWGIFFSLLFVFLGKTHITKFWL